MAYGGDLSRLHQAQQLIKQGKKPSKPANFDLMVNALKPYDYAPEQRLFNSSFRSRQTSTLIHQNRSR